MTFDNDGSLYVSTKTSAETVNPKCPQCGASDVDCNGHRYLKDGTDVQRHLCNSCGFRFSKHANPNTPSKLPCILPHVLKDNSGLESSNQICAKQLVKNLETATEPKTVVGGNKIAEYAWWLKKDGKSEATILGRVKLLRRLVKRGANLYDPESIKKTIAEQAWGNGQKNNAVDAYSSFLSMVGGTWEPPAYKVVRKIPFIPKEAEIDQLIAASSRRMAIFLQLLKETGARCGEIWQLSWDDVDFESKVVNITPEKHSNPRVTRLSNKLLEMLQSLPKNYGDRVFSYPHMRVDHFAVNFQRQRRRTATKIKNPRLLRIHFHTLRYWKGTMLYHETKDMYYVMQRLGHKNIANTLLYVQLEEALFQGEAEYVSKVAKTEAEICTLIDAGFEYVTDFQGSKIFRKRK